MTGTRPFHKSPVLLAAGLLLGGAMLAGLLLAFPGQALASSGPEIGQPQASTEDCLSCHNQPGMTMQLGSGQLFPVAIDPDGFAASVHGQENMQCTDCHKDITGYPHPEFVADDERDVAINYYQICQDCHEEKYDEGADSVHQRAISGGNREAAVCSDCHDAHGQARLYDPQTNELFPEERIKIPNTCANCHNSIFNEYAISAHGEIMLRTGNLDVPTCTECHGVHDIPDPDTAEFRINSPDLCGSCHTDQAMMDKYGLSTAVMNTYVSDFHGSTVTLFQKQSPDQASNKPVCFDCHGAHLIAHVDDPEHGLQVKQNVLVSCQRCHPSANENFPDSWLSHYIPSWDRTPLIAGVNLFYWIVIPLVIGGMIVYVISDFIRRRRDQRKGASHA